MRSAITKNVDFPTYIKAVDEGRKPASKSTVLRVTRPEQPPEFSVDAKGNLVAVDSRLATGRPSPGERSERGVVGAAAKIYRIKVPQLELGLAYKVDSVPPNPVADSTPMSPTSTPAPTQRFWRSPTTRTRPCPCPVSPPRSS